MQARKTSFLNRTAEGISRSIFRSTCEATCFKAISRSCRIFSSRKKLLRASATFERSYIFPAFRRSISSWEVRRSEEHTSELQSLMRISYAVFCLKKKKREYNKYKTNNQIQ